VLCFAQQITISNRQTNKNYKINNTLSKDEVKTKNNNEKSVWVRTLTCSLSSVDNGLSHLGVGEDGGGLNVMPFLLGEGVDANEETGSKMRSQETIIHKQIR